VKNLRVGREWVELVNGKGGGDETRSRFPKKGVKTGPGRRKCLRIHRRQGGTGCKEKGKGRRRKT